MIDTPSELHFHKVKQDCAVFRNIYFTHFSTFGDFLDNTDSDQATHFQLHQHLQRIILDFQFSYIEVPLQARSSLLLSKVTLLLWAKPNLIRPLQSYRESKMILYVSQKNPERRAKTEVRGLR